MKKIDSTATIFDLPLFSKSKHELLSFLELKVTKPGELVSVFTPNPEQLVIASKNSDFFKVLSRGDILIPDGIGLVWASKILAKSGKAKALEERITGADLVEDLVKIAQSNNLKILVVGGQGYEKYGAKKLPLNIQTAASGLYSLNSLGREVYWLPAYKKVKQINAIEEEQLQQVISQLKPELVLVAFGAPQQEIWIDSHRDLLQASQVRLAMATGGAIDFKLGKIRRAPEIIQSLGLEWFYRLLKQPWRWRRQLRLIQFVGMTIGQVAK
jgi:N-acetylglucosaminyldiphosphoundecaprenol N-acetyl-beta-D-mannosaminyltransferase